MDLTIIVSFLIGVVFGLTFGLLRPHKSSGVLKIDHSNPEKDVYRLEINDLDSLSKKNNIILKVDNDSNLSQK